jgi:hypothetical protein
MRSESVNERGLLSVEEVLVLDTLDDAECAPDDMIVIRLICPGRQTRR